MSKFKKVLKKKAVESALSNHPMKNLDNEVKEDYVKGLVFIAVEDETFSDEEKNYIASLIKNLEIDEAKLVEFETFAKEPDEDELIAFMDRIKAFDEDTKINFLIEAVVLAFKDGNFDESEKEMFNDYVEMLELEDKKEIILHMAKALANKDVDLALSLYTADKEFFNKFDYLFDIVDIDIEKELKELYSWEWVEFRLEQGNVEDDNLVASKPVTARQFCVFLNSALISGDLKQVVNTTQFEYDNKVVVKDIDRINLEFDELFSYNEDEKNNDIVGVEDVESFVEFVNSKTENSVKWLTIGTNYTDSKDLIVLDDSAKGLLTEAPEKIMAKTNNRKVAKFLNINEVDYFYRPGGILSKITYNGLEENEDYTFRLMEIEDN